ncbi:MAG: plasmid recombination protein [Bacilli bacterium]|nr:plasmid recombination protein [Bacilli bacterium]
MEELAYSFHLGNDKNKTKKARQVAKTNPSGTTSFNNNGIQTVKLLSKVYNHNYRMYEKNQDEIYVLKGTKDLIKDVKDLYLDLFEESRIKYNDKQTRSDRKINDYFTHISNNDKTDLACEIIIELGDMEYWEEKKKPMKLRMNEVFKEQIDYLEKIVPNFKVASAVSHFDEHSPHLHIVGVPFKTCNKNGMAIQVGKSAIFTKDSLKVIQDKMRINCIEKFNEVYSIDLSLKKKKKGKNQDIPTSEMESYKQEEKTLKKEIKELEEVKLSNTKVIEKQEEQKTIIETEIADKKKYNNKIALKSKATLIKENEELKKDLEFEKSMHYQYEQQYESLKEKTDYLVDKLKKTFNILPQIIKDILDRLFSGTYIDLKFFKQQYDPDEKSKEIKSFKPFTKKKDYNNFEEDYKNEKSKEKDDFEL